MSALPNEVGGGEKPRAAPRHCAPPGDSGAEGGQGASGLREPQPARGPKRVQAREGEVNTIPPPDPAPQQAGHLCAPRGVWVTKVCRVHGQTDRVCSPTCFLISRPCKQFLKRIYMVIISLHALENRPHLPSFLYNSEIR